MEVITQSANGINTTNSLYPGSGLNMIDNYIYFYHTGKFVIMPEYADSVTDSISVNYNSETALTRTAPIYSYSNSGPRSIQVAFNLHRDMLKDINWNNKSMGLKDDEDYVDYVIRNLQTAALPVYQDTSKMVNPPLVALRLGSDIYIKGVVMGQVGVTYKSPIIPSMKANTGEKDLSKHRYSNIDVSFTIEEVDPYDADMVSRAGSFRGLSTSLERKMQNELERMLGYQDIDTYFQSLGGTLA